MGTVDKSIQVSDERQSFFLPGGPRLDCLTTPLALLGVYIPLSVLLMVNFFLGVLVSKKMFQMGVWGLSNCNSELEYFWFT